MTCTENGALRSLTHALSHTHLHLHTPAHRLADAHSHVQTGRKGSQCPYRPDVDSAWSRPGDGDTQQFSYQKCAAHVGSWGQRGGRELEPYVPKGESVRDA